ncbi:HPr kinase/phosphorylase [Jiella sp. MQZ9-1]|uniref:HPr kinase/phosphorylase n=1 Tax=Jiella flava TaxID=2816857 RepID=A0A939JVV8_9HYPH|nr:HPr kinase/phosphorylase [Jiella flava]MBO0661671.1 HPr kinase/phosphorylase [Jiella flava]MCD2470313.1 HPr kinase/phosphorylase [Jiella flava]
MTTASANLHASALALADRGILIRGPARSGKSTLLLALLRRAPGIGLRAELIADDRVIAETIAAGPGGTIRLSAPDKLKGLIEISGVGIVSEPARIAVDLWLVVDLAPQSTILRHPGALQAEILGQAAPRVVLPAREAGLAADTLLSLALSGQLPR